MNAAGTGHSNGEYICVCVWKELYGVGTKCVMLYLVGDSVANVFQLPVEQTSLTLLFRGYPDVCVLSDTDEGQG